MKLRKYANTVDFSRNCAGVGAFSRRRAAPAPEEMPQKSKFRATRMRPKALIGRSFRSFERFASRAERAAQHPGNPACDSVI